MPAAKKATAEKKPAAKTASAKKTEPTLEFREDGFWWIVDGKKETNAGRSKRYAQNMMEEL
jgi:hypothetical protein